MTNIFFVFTYVFKFRVFCCNFSHFYEVTFNIFFFVKNSGFLKFNALLRKENFLLFYKVP